MPYWTLVAYGIGVLICIWHWLWEMSELSEGKRYGDRALYARRQLLHIYRFPVVLGSWWWIGYLASRAVRNWWHELKREADRD